MDIHIKCFIRSGLGTSWQWDSFLNFRCPFIKFFNKIGDIYAALSQHWTERWCWWCHASWNIGSQTTRMLNILLQFSYRTQTTRYFHWHFLKFRQFSRDTSITSLKRINLGLRKELSTELSQHSFASEHCGNFTPIVTSIFTIWRKQYKKANIVKLTSTKRN